VAQLRGEGWQVLAYEPSAETAGDYVLSRRDALASRFDGIFSNNVIEHFRDPVAQFRQFHDLLNEHGVMAHSSPCYEYNVAFTRFHTLFLTGRSLDVLAGRTGFSVTGSTRDGDYINYVLSRV
jgi:2-polyprenyl-3-methyl-5-hydroxy-6-metoxy-1,4-benzoquinol methylase